MSANDTITYGRDQLHATLQASLDDACVKIGEQRQTISELREALADIEGGHLPGMSDLVLAHDWHAVVNLFQHKARAAIAKATGAA